MKVQHVVCLAAAILSLQIFAADAAAITEERCKLVENLAAILSKVEDAASTTAALPKLESLREKFLQNKTATEKTPAPSAAEIEQHKKKLMQSRPMDMIEEDAVRLQNDEKFSALHPVLKELRREIWQLPFGERAGSKPTHTTVTDQRVKVTEDETAILKSVKDDASALGAVARIKALIKKCEQIKKTADGLGDPPPDINHVMKARARYAFEFLKPEIDRVFPEAIRDTKMSYPMTSLLAAIGELDEAMRLNPFKKN